MIGIPVQISAKAGEEDLEDYELEQWREEYGEFRRRGETAIDRAFEINNWGAVEIEARIRLCAQGRN
jgi:hypothetical protein